MRPFLSAARNPLVCLCALLGSVFCLRKHHKSYSFLVCTEFGFLGGQSFPFLNLELQWFPRHVPSVCQQAQEWPPSTEEDKPSLGRAVVSVTRAEAQQHGAGLVTVKGSVVCPAAIRQLQADKLDPRSKTRSWMQQGRGLGTGLPTAELRQGLAWSLDAVPGPVC